MKTSAYRNSMILSIYKSGHKFMTEKVFDTRFFFFLASY